MAKKIIKSEDIKYELPKPKFPDLAMPKPPVVPIAIELSEEAAHPSCNGEDYVSPDIGKSPVEAPPEGMKRIMIGIPILSYSHEFVQSFMKFWTDVIGSDKGNYQIGYHFVYRKPVHMADQVIIDMALYNKCTHVLFIDDDITDYTKEHLDSMLAVDKDVVAGVMYASKFPHAMCIFRKYDTAKKVIDMPADNSMFRLYEVPCLCSNCSENVPGWGIFYCPACGAKQNNLLQKADLVPFCFTLMKTDIFKKMKAPWFHCTTKYPADSWFSDRCTEAGVQQYGHMGVRLTHARVNDTTKPLFFNIGLEENKRKGTGLINIGEDEMNKHQFLLDKKMREAEHSLKQKESPQFHTVGAKKATRKTINPKQEVSNDSTRQIVADGMPKEKGIKVSS